MFNNESLRSSEIPLVLFVQFFSATCILTIHEWKKCTRLPVHVQLLESLKTKTRWLKINQPFILSHLFLLLPLSLSTSSLFHESTFCMRLQKSTEVCFLHHPFKEDLWLISLGHPVDLPAVQWAFKSLLHYSSKGTIILLCQLSMSNFTSIHDYEENHSSD